MEIYQAQPGSPRGRAAPKKRQLLRQANASSKAVNDTLLEDGVPEDIAFQVAEMVGNAVDRALRQLMLNGGGPPVRPNGYALPARTARDVAMEPAASEGHVSRAKRGQIEHVERGDDIMELAKRSKKAGIADPASQKPSKPTQGDSAWLL